MAYINDENAKPNDTDRVRFGFKKPLAGLSDSDAERCTDRGARFGFKKAGEKHADSVGRCEGASLVAGPAVAVQPPSAVDVLKVLEATLGDPEELVKLMRAKPMAGKYDFKDRIQELEGLIKPLKTALAEQLDRRRKLTEALTRVEGDVNHRLSSFAEELAAQHAEATIVAQELAKAHQQVGERSRRIEELQDAAKAQRMEQESFRKKVDSELRRVDEAKELIKERDVALAASKEETEALRASVHAHEKMAAEWAHKAQEQFVDGAQRQQQLLEVSRQRERELVAELDRTTVRAGDLETRLATLESEHDEVSKAHASLQRKHSTFSDTAAALEAAQEIAAQSLRAELKERDGLLMERDDSLRELDASLKLKAADLETLRRELAASNANLQQNEANIEALRRQLTDKDICCEQRDADLDALKSELCEKKVALEQRDSNLQDVQRQLGEQDSLLRQRDADAQASRQQLDDLRRQRDADMLASQVLLDDQLALFKQKAAESQALLEQKDAESQALEAELRATVERKEAELRAELVESKALLEKLEAESQTRFEQRQDEFQALLTCKEGEVQALRDHIDDVSDKLKRSFVEVEALQDKLGARDSALEQKEAQNQELRGQIMSRDDVIRQKDAEVREHFQSIKQMHHDNNELLQCERSRVQRLEHELRALQLDHDALKDVARASAKDLDVVRGELGACECKRSELQTALQDLEVQADVRFKAADERAGALLQEKADLEAEFQRFIEQRSADIEALRQQLATCEAASVQKSASLKDTILQKSDMLRQRDASLDEKQRRLDEKDDMLRERDANLLAAQQQLSEKQAVLERIDAESQVLFNRHEAESKALHDRIDDASGALERKCAEVKSLQDSLGAKEAALEQRDSEVQELRSQLFAREAVIRQKDDEVREHFHSIKQMHHDNNEQLQCERSRAQRLEAELRALQLDHDTLKEGARDSAKELEAMRGELAACKRLGSELQGALQHAEAERDQVANAAAESQTALHDREEAFKAATAALHDARDELAVVQAKFKAEEERAGMLAQEKTELGVEFRSYKEHHGTGNQQQMQAIADLKVTVDKLSHEVQVNKTEQGVLRCTMAQQQSYAQSLEQQLAQADAARRELHNVIQELKGNIRVFCRVRPVHDGADPSVQIPEPGKLSVSHNSESHTFSFDKVFDMGSMQEDVFDEVSGLVQSALDGYKVCLFAYGQTGSGKTFTMQGTEQPGSWGLIPRSLRQIFQASEAMRAQGWTWTLHASFLEVYNEALRDLLCSASGGGNNSATPVHVIKHDEAWGTIVTNLTSVEVDSMEQINALMARAAKHRAVGSTDMNAVSSRSHSIFALYLRGANRELNSELHGALHLVDLAGSERLSKSGATGDRLKETQNINRSLSCLTDVFLAKAEGRTHVPFRNSKLTHLMEPCLSGQGKTLMVVNVAPEQGNSHETLCSLRFASQVSQCNTGGKPKRSAKAIQQGGYAPVVGVRSETPARSRPTSSRGSTK
mmetsp:Transcript_66798/g.186386  ORF Transcript_66798/g.186386 Transcript_66798/m.186386 type:complete len:1491 (+) Transcript_66798:106-4578(+)